MYEAEEEARKALFHYIILLMKEIKHCREMANKFPRVPKEERHLLMDEEGNVIENRAYWEAIKREVNATARKMAEAYKTGFAEGEEIDDIYYLAQQCIPDENQIKEDELKKEMWWKNQAL